MVRRIINIPGWRTKNKIVIIESDDWGSLRMESKEAYEYFLRKGYPVNLSAFNKYDSIESETDLTLLFDVLSSVRDSNDNPAVMTINNAVANPDFERIKASDYEYYYYELFTETYKRYPCSKNVFDLWQEGINRKIIYPQLHGREHLNINRWMKALKNREKESMDAFRWNMFSIATHVKLNNQNEFLDALGYDHPDEIQLLQKILIDSSLLFSKIWGFKSKSFIAPCFIWPTILESTLKDMGIDYLQGAFVQYQPKPIHGSYYKSKYHYQGQSNNINQRYLIRNAYLEPSSDPNNDWISDCLKSISIAFSFYKPAIISSHRVNYMGSINPMNRDNNLKLLKKLLSRITKLWPDVHFMTSNQLGDLMNERGNV
jgi:hypothetical protein